MLDDLAKARRVGDYLEADGRPNLEAVMVEQGSETRDHVSHKTSDVGRLEGRRLVRHDADRGEDRVDEPVVASEPASPRVTQPAASEPARPFVAAN